MALRPVLSLLATASAGLATPLAACKNAETKLKWGKCDFVSPNPVECATLDVPLDYTGPDCETLSLSIAKMAAANGPAKGSILMNFGGPGNEAIKTLGAGGPMFQNMTGGHHNLIAFDPRGTGETMPLSCFDKEEDREAYLAKSTLVYDESDDAPDELWKNAGEFAEVCKETMEGGELVGTAFVARDLMEVVDALDEDGLLRYWGISYGSVLGATVANMFPERMDKIVLDGVADTENYYHGFHVDKDQMGGADKAWLSFLGECIDAGDKCAISNLNNTASDLADTFSRAAERYRDPVTVDGTDITYSTVETLAYTMIKNPNNLEDLSVLLRAVITGEGLKDVAEYTSSLGAAIGTEALLGIACGDTIPRADTREGVMDEVEHILESSKNFGGMLPPVSMACAQWPFEAKERRPVDGTVETPNPVLFIGNTYDAATAVDTAYKMSERFPGSVVVEQKGYGHASIAQKSKCTWKVMGDYFNDGTLPDGNIKCEVEGGLF